jgi:RHS repeat-associated protein
MRWPKVGQGCVRPCIRTVHHTERKSYDALNRLTSKTYSDTTPTVTYSYDQTSYNGLIITYGKGRRTGMVNGSGQTAWSYDPGGRILTEKRTISGVTKTTSYTYNLAGLVASITYPTSNTITYSYDNSENQSSVVDSGSNINYALNVSYAPNPAITSALHGQVSGGFAGITRTYAYNSRLQPNTMVVSSANGTVQNLTYSYDLGGGVNNGNVVSITNNLNTDRTQSFTYDFLNRIATAQSQATSGSFCWAQSFGMDRYGNLNTINVTKCSAPTLSLAFNNNQITNTNFAYDAAGNMKHDGSQPYTWNAENQLITAAGVTYTYHGDGWRVKSSNGTLFWRGASCGNPILTETDLNGNNPQEFIYLAGRHIATRQGSTVYYFFDDQLGSGRVLTNSTGVTQQESDYYPYGGEIVVTNSVDNRYKFSGKRRDTETGFDYSLYRMYYPNLGVWMSADPVKGNAGNPQSQDLYPYVQNNPTNLVDPLGNAIGGGFGCTPSTADFWGLFDAFLSQPLGGPVIFGPAPMCVDGAWFGDFGDFIFRKPRKLTLAVSGCGKNPAGFDALSGTWTDPTNPIGCTLSDSLVVAGGTCITQPSGLHCYVIQTGNCQTTMCPGPVRLTTDCMKFIGRFPIQETSHCF